MKLSLLLLTVVVFISDDAREKDNEEVKPLLRLSNQSMTTSNGKMITTRIRHAANTFPEPDELLLRLEISRILAMVKGVHRRLENM